MKKSRLIFLSALGSGLEYFDFVIYALAVSYISHTFFPKDNAWLGYLESLLVFATGYVVRPLGGMIFGIIGDKYGRKKSFTNAILLMGFATFAIACLPGYHVLGLASPLLLTLFRALQGIAQGAELAGAYTFIFEHEKSAKNAPKSLAIVSAGVGFGGLLGSLVFALLNTVLNDADMHDFGWRIAFFLGGFVAFLAYLLRRFSEETPAFLKEGNLEDNKPLITLLRFYYAPLLRGIFLVLFPASFIIYFLFIPSFLSQFYAFDAKTAYSMLTFGLLFSAVLMPFFGKLAVLIGSKKQMGMTLMLSLVLISVIFYLLSFNKTSLLFVFVICYQGMIGSLAACYSPLLANAFPTKIRYTGVAVSYNIAFALAGFTPFLIAFAIGKYHNPVFAPIILTGYALLSLISLKGYKAY